MTEEMRTFRAIINFDEFDSGGISTDLQSALARPYRKILETGKPCGHITHIFARDEEGTIYILGSLGYSPGGRVIFYPGLTDRSHNWFIHKGDLSDQVSPTGFIDHFSIEPDLQSWHVTYIGTKGKKSQERVPRFHLISEDEILMWFGLSIADYSVLELAPKKFYFDFEWPAKDGDRVADCILESRKNADLRILESAEKRSDYQDESFIHFDFYICPENYCPPGDIPSCAPVSPPILKEKSTGDSTKLIRRHNISLEGFDNNVMVCSMIKKGTLTIPSVLVAIQQG